MKIDMRMLRGIRHDSASARLVRHIVAFAREESIRVVAEGIETAQERDVVKELGVDLLQGYFFAKPAEPFCNVENAA